MTSKDLFFNSVNMSLSYIRNVPVVHNICHACRLLRTQQQSGLKRWSGKLQFFNIHYKF